MRGIGQASQSALTTYCGSVRSMSTMPLREPRRRHFVSAITRRTDQFEGLGFTTLPPMPLALRTDMPVAFYRTGGERGDVGEWEIMLLEMIVEGTFRVDDLFYDQLDIHAEFAAGAQQEFFTYDEAVATAIALREHSEYGVTELTIQHVDAIPPAGVSFGYLAFERSWGAWSTLRGLALSASCDVAAVVWETPEEIERYERARTDPAWASSERGE